MWFLELDSRERGFNFENLIDPNNTTFIVKQLQVGDIQIRNNDNIVAIFERKTVSDLLSSLKDGRYSEQKKRLLSSNSIHKGYIIEGNFKNDFIVWQIIMRLQCKDRLICFTTDDIYSTQKIICELINKFKKDIKMYKPMESPENNYIDCLHVQKKKNITFERCFLMQLKQIPGISTKTAEAIANKYQNWNELINIFNTKNNQEIKKEFSAKDRIGIKKIEIIRSFTINPTNI